jgi:hypothetical protein
LIVKKLISCVRPGLPDTRASPSAFVRRLMRDDLPTFERPMNANSGNEEAGQVSRLTALSLKFAEWIFTVV